MKQLKENILVTNFINVSNMTLKAETIGEDCQTQIQTYQNFCTHKQETQVACLPVYLKVLSLMFGGIELISQTFLTNIPNALHFEGWLKQSDSWDSTHVVLHLLQAQSTHSIVRRVNEQSTLLKNKGGAREETMSQKLRLLHLKRSSKFELQHPREYGISTREFFTSCMCQSISFLQKLQYH